MNYNSFHIYEFWVTRPLDISMEAFILSLCESDRGYEMSEKITNTYIGGFFGWDYLEEVRWDILQQTVLSARHILSNPEKFPKAQFDSLERMDDEGTRFLLRGPIQYII